MFIITVNSNSYIWNNNLEDDFLEATRRYFDVTSDQMGVLYVPNNQKSTISNHIESSPTNTILLDGTNLKLMVDNNGTPEQSGNSIVLQSLSQWPYDSEGNFLGNNLNV